MDSQQNDIHEILEIVQFLKDNVMTRSETENRFTEVKSEILPKVVGIEETIRQHMVTKEELQEFKGGIYSHIDAFAKLHETLDLELVSLRGKYDRLEERMVKLEQKVGVY